MWILLLLSVGEAVLALEPPRLRDRATPRATDLLHAQRLAERAEGRLKTPAPHGSGWVRGGGGWDAPRTAPTESGSVTIQIRPARRRPAAR